MLFITNKASKINDQTINFIRHGKGMKHSKTHKNSKAAVSVLSTRFTSSTASALSLIMASIASKASSKSSDSAKLHEARSGANTARQVANRHKGKMTKATAGIARRLATKACMKKPENKSSDKRNKPQSPTHCALTILMI